MSATHIANLFEFGSFQNINELSLRAFLVDPNMDVCNPNNFVTEAEFLAIFKVLISNSNNQYFGLNYGQYLNIKALGFILEISLNTSSIEQAVLILQQYLSHSFPLISLIVEQDEINYNLILDSKITDKKTKNHLLDIVYTFMHRELVLMLNEEFRPVLQLPYDNTQPYTLQLDAEIKKGKRHLISFNKQALKTEINKEKVKKIEHLLPEFMRMLEMEDNAFDNFSKQIRNMTLNMCSPEIPTFEQVSKQFPMSDRTIQRKLTSEGYSFRKISDQIKKELSTYLKIGKQLKTQDIAYILGYSEPSAYLHAVKRWASN